MITDIKKCIETHDIKGLRYIFVDCLDVDPTFEKYREDYEVCKSISGFFDKHQELHGILADKSRWTKQYWEQLKLDLMKNFSQIRFEHMIKAAQVVYADKIARLLHEREVASAKDVPGTRKAVNGSHSSLPERVVCLPDSVDSGSRSGKKISGKEQQDRMIEEEKRKLEEHNRRVEEAQAATRARIEAATKQSSNRQQSMQNGESGSKKGMGAVLLIMVIVVVVLLIMVLR